MAHSKKHANGMVHHAHLCIGSAALIAAAAQGLMELVFGVGLLEQGSNMAANQDRMCALMGHIIQFQTVIQPQ
jgi:hypothetical protein